MSFTLSCWQVFLNSVFRQLWSIEAPVDCDHDLTTWLVGHVTVDLCLWLRGRNVFLSKRKTGR